MSRIKDLMGTGQSGGAAQAIAGTVAAITATGNNSQANAALLSAETNVVTTASTTNSVVLPTNAQNSAPGDSMCVFNTTSTACNLFPGGSETINGSTSAVSVAQNKMALLKRISATGWGLVITA